ncbi:MAG: hypothetical protein IH851_07870 [Armatimonadetes bacterium]|nr:hypothetical protein [Armatimonadota bacterium]
MSEKRILAWFFIVAGWTVVLAVVLANTGFRDWYEQRFADGRTRLDYNREADPNVGDTVPLPETDVFGRPIMADGLSGNVLVVAAGSCTECSLKTLNPEAIQGDRFERVLLIYTDSAEHVRSQLKTLPGRCFAVSDPEGEAMRFLNAVWTPRFYLADPSMRLLEIQTDSTRRPKYVQIAVNRQNAEEAVP